MKTPYEIDMNERKSLLNKIIIDAGANPAIDINRTLDLFQYMDSELEIYKYSGYVDRFQAKLTNELNTNIGGFKDFLQETIPIINITIFQYLMVTIK